MQESLAILIERFRSAQDRGVAYVIDVLGPRFGIRRPASTRDWVANCAETGLYRVRQVDDVEVYAHGYGIELTFTNGSIDFDWGDNGECDGFDEWRLYNFARSNPSDAPCPEYVDVKQWIEEALAAGELTQDRCLYYSPAHRAPDASRPTNPSQP